MEYSEVPLQDKGIKDWIRRENMISMETAEFIEFLKCIRPYVVLCGSYARYEENAESDLDFYVRQREIPDDEEPPIDTSYLPEIIEICRKFGYRFDSCVIGSISIPRKETGVMMVELSYLYKLPIHSPVTEREVFGVPFLTCIDDKTASYESLYDITDDYGRLVNRLPEVI